MKIKYTKIFHFKNHSKPHIKKPFFPHQLTTETKVALDMSGISFGGGDSPLVRLGLAPTAEVEVEVEVEVALDGSSLPDEEHEGLNRQAHTHN